MMQKLSKWINESPVEYSHPPHFHTETMEPGVTRLIIGVPHGNIDVLLSLLECVEEPFAVLYILHTSRGEGEPGRYQSPELSREELVLFLNDHQDYWGADARHDLWVRSFFSASTIVWERHNLIYAYGVVGCFKKKLCAQEFVEHPISMGFPHVHHYREEFDDSAKAVLEAFPWSYSELRPEDQQHLS